MRVNMLKAQMVLKGYNQERLAGAIGISVAALWNKLHGRSDFTRKEIAELIRLLDIKEPMEIFFAD